MYITIGQMSDKTTKIIAFVALGVMIVFTIGLVISFIGFGGWWTTGITIGAGVLGIALFIILKVKMRKTKQEKEAESAGKKKELFDDLIEPEEK